MWQQSKHKCNRNITIFPTHLVFFVILAGILNRCLHSACCLLEPLWAILKLIAIINKGVFVLLSYKSASYFWFQWAADSIIRELIKQLYITSFFPKSTHFLVKVDTFFGLLKLEFFIYILTDWEWAAKKAEQSQLAGWGRQQESHITKNFTDESKLRIYSNCLTWDGITLSQI